MINLFFSFLAIPAIICFMLQHLLLNVGVCWYGYSILLLLLLLLFIILYELSWAIVVHFEIHNSQFQRHSRSEIIFKQRTKSDGILNVRKRWEKGLLGFGAKRERKGERDTESISTLNQIWESLQRKINIRENIHRECCRVSIIFRCMKHSY